MTLNAGWCYREQVDRAAAGWTVLDYYTQRHPHSARSQWQQRILTAQILLNGHPTTPEAPLALGQQLTYDRPPWQEPDAPLEFQIIYEDAELLVVSKPAGLPVLPGGGFLQHTLLWQVQQHDRHAAPIHRLGRGTSGLVLMARSPVARANLTQQMRDRQIQKHYRALAVGVEMPDQFTVTQPIGKQPHPILGYIHAAHAAGLPAQSYCRVLRRDRTATLLEVEIVTGRSHQIRIHLAAAGHPLVGDPLYAIGGVPLPLIPTKTGGIPVPGDCGYHLHAMQLAFTHPNGQPMVFVCSPPDELGD